MDRQNIRFFASFCKGLFEKHAADWALFLLIIFTAIASFGLGRLSAGEEGPAPLITRMSASQTASAAMPDTPEGAVNGSVVASKSGSAYHLPWCPGASRISPQNLVSFESEQQAREAGYSPAKNCKGLISE